ncbi:MAG: hypothetical protein ACOX7H_04555 [Bacillota bacterium]
MLVIILAVAVTMTGCGGSDRESGATPGQNINRSDNQAQATLEPIIDVTKFIGISPDELVAMLGEPTRIDELDTSYDGYYHKEYVYRDLPYSYNGKEGHFSNFTFSFVKFESGYKLTELNMRFYNYSRGDEPFLVPADSDIFSLLGITPDPGMIKERDYPQRYAYVTDDIDYMVVLSDKTEDGQIDLWNVIITYIVYI